MENERLDLKEYSYFIERLFCPLLGVFYKVCGITGLTAMMVTPSGARVWHCGTGSQ